MFYPMPIKATLSQAEKCDSGANLEVGFWLDLSCKMPFPYTIFH